MQTFTIGRNASNNIVLNDKMVSRNHAELIVFDNGQVIIRDLGSSNGTFVNGNRIKECNLKPGDIVKCATTFFNWSQYVNVNVNPPIDYDKVQPQPKPVVEPVEVVVDTDFNLSVALKYIFTRIFSIGDMFKREWNMNSSIMFFLITPLLVILLCCLFIFTKYSTNFAQTVIFPLIWSIFIFGLPQFITLSLFSINKETNFTKNLFASSIFSFLQFLPLVVIGIAVLIIYLLVGDGIKDIANYPLMLSIIYLLGLSVLASISVTLLIFIYKYFRIIGVSKGISIHLTILTYTVNLILQIIFSYSLVSLAFKNYNAFDFLKNFQ